jgi:hypothetical protein
MKRTEVKKISYLALLVLGIGLVIAGGFFTQERWGGILIGLGAGIFGMAGGQLITQRVIERNPALTKQINIEQFDERNVQINNYAKAKAFDFLQFFALPFFLIMILADVDLWVVLLAIGFYVADWAVYLWLLNKRMQDA